MCCLIVLMMEAVRTSETSVDNHFTRQYIPEDNSEHHHISLLYFPLWRRVVSLVDSKYIALCIEPFTIA
jgi:hypothetical protein